MARKPLEQRAAEAKAKADRYAAELKEAERRARTRTFVLMGAIAYYKMFDGKDRKAADWIRMFMAKNANGFFDKNPGDQAFIDAFLTSEMVQAAERGEFPDKPPRIPGRK